MRFRKRQYEPRLPLSDDEIRAAYRELVERGMLVVTKYDPDPMECVYAMPDREDVEKALADLAALGIATL